MNRYLCLLLIAIATVAQAQENEYDPLNDSNPEAVRLWNRYLQFRFEDEGDKCLMARADLDTICLQYQRDVLENVFLKTQRKRDADGNVKWVVDETPLPYYYRAIRLTEAKYGLISREVSQCYKRLGSRFSLRDNKRAIAAYNKALIIEQKRSGGDPAPVLSELAELYGQRKDYSQALKHINRAIKVTKKEWDLVWYYELQGTILLANNKPKQAVKAYEKRLKKLKEIQYSDNIYRYGSSLYENMSLAFEQTGDLDKAIVWLTAHVKKEESEYYDEGRQYTFRVRSIVTGNLNLMRLYHEKGDNNAAVYYGRKAIKCAKQSNASYLFDNYITAVSSSTIDIRGYKIDNRTLLLQYVQLDRSKREDVLHWLMEYAEDECIGYDSQELLYLTYAMMGCSEWEDDDVEKYFQRAISMMPNRKEAYELYGISMVRQDNREQALAMWEKVCTLEKDKENLRQSDFYKLLLSKKYIKKI